MTGHGGRRYRGFRRSHEFPLKQRLRRANGLNRARQALALAERDLRAGGVERAQQCAHSGDLGVRSGRQLTAFGQPA